MKSQLDRIKLAPNEDRKIQRRAKTWSPNGDMKDQRKNRRDWKIISRKSC